MDRMDEIMQELDSGEVFIDYGPVSMVVSAVRDKKPDPELAKEALHIVERCLSELRDALKVLKQFPGEVVPEDLSGLGLNMANAVLATGCDVLTPMAAVAGTISDAVADELFARGAEKVFANNGGDIALRLREGESIRLGVKYDLKQKKGADRTVRITSELGIGGVATSGLGGRSFTTGIADGVTVFAGRCAQADAAATLLANASFLDIPKVHRRKCREIDPDSDIADLDIVTGVDPLSESEKQTALSQVMKEAKKQFERKNILACIATVQGNTQMFDPKGLLEQERKRQ